jgi:hypothetical protein
MKPEIKEQILSLIEAKAAALPTAMEFELAYQVRVAIDRIRFAIKHMERFEPRTDQMHEAGLQLLDALERLESAERKFQTRYRAHRGFSNGGLRTDASMAHAPVR